MPLAREAFEIDSLKRVEQVYRQRLTDDPADMRARTGLAWCLFMQALYQAGQERVLAALAEDGTAPEALEEQFQAVPDTDSRDLLRDALRQTIAVSQLSGDPAAQSEVERLQDLVRLSGESQALSEAEEEASRILTEITRAILADEPPPAPRPRRRRPR